MPVENGQCMIDSLEMKSFTALPWWVTFRNFMDAMAQEEAGLPESKKTHQGQCCYLTSFFRGSLCLCHMHHCSHRKATHTHATTKHKHTHTADMKSHTASFAGTKASLTVGELISLLALCDEDPLCINCCHRLGRQCAALMSEHLYRYAEHRGSNTSLVEQQKNQTFCMEQ